MTPIRRTGPTATDPSDTNTLTLTIARRSRLRQVVTRRRHAARLDVHTARMYAVELSEAGQPTAECGGWHVGECDPWSSCTGMDLGAEQRDQLGAQHPYREAA